MPSGLGVLYIRYLAPGVRRSLGLFLGVLFLEEASELANDERFPPEENDSVPPNIFSASRGAVTSGGNPLEFYYPRENIIPYPSALKIQPVSFFHLPAHLVHLTQKQMI